MPSELVFYTLNRNVSAKNDGVVEAHDEWQVADKRYLSESTLALLHPTERDDQSVAVPAAITA
jgi:hypothetical protein